MPLVLIAIAGFLLRVAGLLGRGGPLAAATGYDDGVYFSASALLLRGVLPYRDFVFVHPPGILYFLAPASWAPDPGLGFVVARVLACVVGGVNVYLAGRIVSRAAGTFGGIVAAVLYAIYPDAVIAERSAYLEPFLNLACLLSIRIWLDEQRRPFTAGVLAGLACAVKFWGGIWVLAAVASAPKGRFRTDVPRFIAGAAIAGVLLLAPLWLPAPGDFVTQTLNFQLSRPPDGTIDKAVRLREMLDSGHRAATVLTIIGLAVAIRRIRERHMRLFAFAFLLTVAGFLASSSYWSHYNSHLAVSQCALAGLGAAALVQWRRSLAVAVVLLIAVLDASTLLRTMRAQVSPDLLTVARSVPSIVPERASFFAFDPVESLIARRLPPHGDGAPVVVDSYGAMLLEATTRANGRFPDTAAAFRNNPHPSAVRERLAATDFVLLGWRGRWQLNEGDLRWFTMHFECVNPEAEELCIWKKRAWPRGEAPLIEAQFVRYGEGWYGEEAGWRWMAGRSVTLLPPREGAARLTLRFDVPLDQLGGAPIVTVEFDGRVLDRFSANGRTVERTYAIDWGAAPHTLVISTSRTFNPARAGRSSDTRDLGLSLTALTWRSGDSGAASTSSRR
jgi:hypothetical protein